MVYLDYASTTPIRPEVIEKMQMVLSQSFGNPSSTHSWGRKSKVLIEDARKHIAQIFNAKSQEIIFTSSATEANNWILFNVVNNLNIKRIISTRIEHHSVLDAIGRIKEQNDVEVVYLEVDKYGMPNLELLEKLLADNQATLVSLMHVNNEIGTILDLQKVASVCKMYKAYFHTDTVQSVGKMRIDLEETPIDFMVGSAHKFYGPKGIGFVYVRKNLHLKPIFIGGNQERGLRAGTEAVHQIVGLQTALTLAYQQLEKDNAHNLHIKNYLLNQLELHIQGAKINGLTTQSVPNILNITLPFKKHLASMMVFSLDLKGVAVSRGSACQSGSNEPSHVLEAILTEEEINLPSIRVSWGIFTTKDDIDKLVVALKELSQN
ncbi:MAG: cysteine desulfurase family protein [Bacteroidota bacterium]|nr:cysteine desulfurase family protein [Bacteroidota bacterium]